MLDPHVLRIDAARETERICQVIREQVLGTLRRLRERVLALMMPEQSSSDESLVLGGLLADVLGMTTQVEHIAPALAALGCCAKQESAIRTAVPAYGEGHRCKLVSTSILEGERLPAWCDNAPPLPRSIVER